MNYSDKDQVLFGKIEGINGLVNFEGESVKELTEAFQAAKVPGAKVLVPFTPGALLIISIINLLCLMYFCRIDKIIKVSS